MLSGTSKWVGILVFGALCAMPAAAVTTYSAGTDNVCTGTQTDSAVGQGVLVASGFFQCGTATGLFLGQGSAAARADSGGIGVSVDFLSGGFGNVAQAWGEIETTFVVNGPVAGAEIPVSINFVLSGILGGGSNAGQVSYRTIENRAQIIANLPNGGGTVGRTFAGTAVETFDSGLNPGLSLAISGDLAGNQFCLGAGLCAIQSPVFNVYAGETNTLRLWARAKVDSASGTGYGFANFLNTFKFDPNQNVFNLPNGYTVTIEGMNVVNNRVGGQNGGGEVPEPGTYVLVGGGLVFAMMGRRSRER